MQGLFGDFSTMPLKDLVVYLGNKKASGRLRLELGEMRKEVLLKDGAIISASSNEPREFLGQFLINMGYITEDQFHRAYQTQKETKVFLGKILVMIGLVSEATVLNALSLKMRETLLSAFIWPKGTFHFDAAEVADPPEGVELTIELLDVHREAEFRETAWQAIRAAFPSGNVQLEVEEANFPEPPAPGSLDHRLVTLIRSGHTIDDIILALHATDFFLYQRLYALYRLEAVRVADSVEVELDEEPPEESPVSEEPSSLADLLQAAERFLAAGAYDDAEPLARKAHELAGNSQTESLVRKSEEGLLAQLRVRLVDEKRVPKLKVSRAQLKTMTFSAQERYLLSRIDGTRDVATIVSASPLRELDALRLFHCFVENQLISL